MSNENAKKPPNFYTPSEACVGEGAFVMAYEKTCTKNFKNLKTCLE